MSFSVKLHHHSGKTNSVWHLEKKTKKKTSPLKTCFVKEGREFQCFKSRILSWNTTFNIQLFKTVSWVRPRRPLDWIHKTLSGVTANPSHTTWQTLSRVMADPLHTAWQTLSRVTANPSHTIQLLCCLVKWCMFTSPKEQFYFQHCNWIFPVTSSITTRPTPDFYG